MGVRILLNRKTARFRLARSIRTVLGYRNSSAQSELEPVAACTFVLFLPDVKSRCLDFYLFISETKLVFQVEAYYLRIAEATLEHQKAIS